MVTKKEVTTSQVEVVSPENGAEVLPSETIEVEEPKDRAQLWFKAYEWCEAKPKSKEVDESEDEESDADLDDLSREEKLRILRDETA